MVDSPRQTETPNEGRPWCARCRRPKAVCWCDRVTPVQSNTKVIFVQHPKESKVPVSTCRMAHLSLPNSELFVTLSAEEEPRLAEALKRPRTAILFPARDATDVEALTEMPEQLVVIDGTWDNARKLFQRSPQLAALPRIGFRPEKPGNYRIRKEPAEHCLATIEAIAYVLERLEKAPGKFTPILQVFDRMVDLQLGFIERREGASRYKHPRKKTAPRRTPAQEVQDVEDRLVLLYAEANSWPADSGMTGFAELLQLVAVRVSTGERFETILQPLRAIAPMAPEHLGIPLSVLQQGDSRSVGLDRFRQFLTPNDVLGTWGKYPIDLLRGEGLPTSPHLDLRTLTSRQIKRRPGGVEAAVGFPETGPRAQRRLCALEEVAKRFLETPQTAHSRSQVGETAQKRTLT